MALRLLCRRVRITPLIMAEVADVTFYTTSAWPFLCNNQNQPLDQRMNGECIGELYQVACHMLRKKSPSQPHPNNSHTAQHSVPLGPIEKLTERRQYTQAVGMHIPRLANDASMAGIEEKLVVALPLTVVYFASFLRTLACRACACTWRRRPRLRILAVPCSILLHDIGFYNLRASIGYRRLVIVTVCCRHLNEQQARRKREEAVLTLDRY